MSHLRLYLLGTVFLVSCTHVPPEPDRLPTSLNRPNRFLLLFFDGIRPSDAASLSHFNALSAKSLTFPDALVGHMPSIPLVSYLVATTGRFPRSLPWQDTVFRDAAGRLRNTGRLDGKQTREYLTPFLGVSSLASAMRRWLGRSFTVSPTREAGLYLGGQAVDELMSPEPPLSGKEGITWVGEKVRAIVDKNDWRLCIATFGDIVTAENREAANQELGAVLARLQATSQMANTVLIVTGAYAVPAEAPLAPPLPPFGDPTLFVDSAPPPASFASAVTPDLVEAAVFGSFARFWTKPLSPEMLAGFLKKLRQIPKVRELYAKYDTGGSLQYVRSYRKRGLGADAARWVQERHPELVQSYSSPGSADVVALLDDTGWMGEAGRLGGAQESVQRIPFMVYGPHLKRATSIPGARARLVDILPIAAAMLDLPVPPEAEGTSHGVELWIEEGERVASNPSENQ